MLFKINFSKLTSKRNSVTLEVNHKKAYRSVGYACHIPHGRWQISIERKNTEEQNPRYLQEILPACHSVEYYYQMDSNGNWNWCRIREARVRLIGTKLDITSEELEFHEHCWAYIADPSGRAIEDVDLRLLACWDCGFESRRGHGRLLWMLCFQVEVSVSGWSLFQRSPKKCGVYNECDREAP